MATSFIDETYTYGGKDAKEWYTLALNGAPTLDLIKKHLGVKNHFNVPSLNSSESLKAATCAFDESGTITAGTRRLTVVALAVNKTICLEDLEPLFISESMKLGSNNADFLPADFAKILAESEMGKVSEELEQLIWNGDTAGATGTYLDLFDGLIKKMLADADIIDVVGTTLTSVNIISELSKVVAAIPKPVRRIRNRDNVGIALSNTAMALYMQAIAASSPTGFYDTVKEGPMTFLGFKLFELDGLDDNDMVAGDFGLVWFGTDLMSDVTDIKIIPLMETTGDDAIRIKMRMMAGVEYGNGTQIVLYHS